MVRTSSAASGTKRRPLIAVGYGMFWVLGWTGVVIPSLVRSIEGDFGVGNAGISLLYFLAALLFAAGSLAGGFVVERFGWRASLVGGACVSAVGFAAAGVAPLWPFFILAACIQSAGGSVIDAQMTALLLDLSPQGRGAMASVLNAFLSVGALIAPLAIGFAVTIGAPWRGAFLVAAIAYLTPVPALRLLSMPSGRRGAQEGAAADDVDLRERSLLPFAVLAVGMAINTGVTIGISDWMVRFLSDLSLTQATAVLSAFWGGIALSRFLSNWVVERVAYVTLVTCSILLGSITVVGAVLSGPFALRITLFTLAGLFYGPGFPLILAIGATIYPHRIALLSGSLTMAAGIGVIVLPPLMGILASAIGVRATMLGIACLGVPVIGCILTAVRLARRSVARRAASLAAQE